MDDIIDKEYYYQGQVNLGTDTIVKAMTESLDDSYNKLQQKYGIMNIGESVGENRQSEVDFITDKLKQQQDALNKIVSYASIQTDKEGNKKLSVNEEQIKKLEEEIAKTQGDLSLAKLKALDTERDKFLALVEETGSYTKALELQEALKEGIAKEDVEFWKAKKKREEALANIVKAQSLMDVGSNLKNQGIYEQSSWKELGGVIVEGMSSFLNMTDLGGIVDKLISGEDVGEVIFDTFVEELVKLIGGLEGVNAVLEPLSNAFKNLEPLAKTIAVALVVISHVLDVLFNKIMKFLNWITNGWFDEMASLWDEYVEAQSNATKSTEELTKQQQSLLQAMIAQEEYYIGMKKQINSDSYRDSVYSVNDMILTPNGRFSTSPQDTIIAMKHPEQMMNSGVSIKIVNNAGVDVNARQGDNKNEFLITISKKVANDYAYGLNGWDNATRVRQVTEQGSVR